MKINFYISDCEIHDVQSAGHHLLYSLAIANTKIRSGRQNQWECGTTTMITGLLLQTQSKYTFVAASIGDCKVYQYKQKEKTFSDLTFNNREISLDPSDPGGRLGPFGSNGSPDLRNLDLYSTPCEKGDLIICVSDGIHDNLDPELLGFSPKDLNINAESWKEIQPATLISVKAKFTQRLLYLLFNNFRTKNDDDDDDNKDDNPILDYKLTAKQCVNVLIQHALNVTQITREWVFSNPQAKLPTNYRKYPGKLDHTSCVVFEVGANHEGLSLSFQRTQDRLVSLHSQLIQNFTMESISLERKYFSLNMPIQVSIAYSDTHVSLFCRTISTGKFDILVDETTAYIKVYNCIALNELIDNEEFSSLNIIHNDELNSPIERTIDLPFSVESDPAYTKTDFNAETGLLRIDIKRKISPMLEQSKPIFIPLSSTGEAFLSPRKKEFLKRSQ